MSINVGAAAAPLSSVGRALAEQVVRASDELGASLSTLQSGNWSSSYLWAQGVLNMRVLAGDLLQGIENLKEFGDDVFSRLSGPLQAKFNDAQKGAQHILDEIHKDQGGVYDTAFKSFDGYAADVASELKVILKQADDAERAAASQAQAGVHEVDWVLVGDDVPAPAATTQAQKAAERVLSAGAGG